MPSLKDNFTSIPYFEKALQSTTKKYKYNSNRESKAPLDAWYLLGDAYKLQSDFENAEKCYDSYLASAKNKRNSNIEYVEREKNSIPVAKQILQYPKSIKKDSLLILLDRTDEIQSCPVVSDNGDLLVFCMGNNNIFPPDFKTEIPIRDYQMDKIYMSVKENGMWQKPINIMKMLHAKELTIPTDISSDGKTLYLVRDDNDNGNIYYSEFKNGKFGRMKKLGKNINTRFWESHASISDDGTSLYFTSDRKGGYGGLDIYVSQKDSKGNWGPAKNIGKTINTPNDEETPFIINNGNTLYFSSQGHFNMGGFDVFCSAKADTGWTEPLNMGYPINTVGNDLVYLPKIDTNYAFAPLNRYEIHGIQGSNNDLYINLENPNNLISAFTISGKIDSGFEKFDLSEAKNIIVTDSVSNNVLSLIPTISDNSYQLVLTPGKHSLVFKLNGYKPVVFPLNLPPIFGNNHVSADITFEPTETLLASLEVKDTISSDNLITTNKLESFSNKNILFDFDKSVASGYDSYIDSLIFYLKSQPQLSIQLTGFADATGDYNYNKLLSKRRAEFIASKLIAAGIDENRIKVDWKGEDLPIATNSTINGRKLNRRVEISFINH